MSVSPTEGSAQPAQAASSTPSRLRGLPTVFRSLLSSPAAFAAPAWPTEQVRQSAVPLCINSHQAYSQDTRTKIEVTSFGGFSSGTTWGNITASNVHAIPPGINLDASLILLTRDTQGISGGVITSADGWGHGADDEERKNIADIAREACLFLSRKLRESNSPDELYNEMNKIIDDTDDHLKKQNGTVKLGATNLAGVRMFARPGENQVRVVGVNVGNQRVLVTHAQTGETSQINNVAGDDDSTLKCYLGGIIGHGQVAYKPDEIERIDVTLNIAPEHVLLWIATDGAWQNFEKRDDPMIIHTTLLQPIIGPDSQPETLLKNLTDHVQARSAKVRDYLPEYSREADRLHAELARDETPKPSYDRLMTSIKWNLKALDDATITVLAPFQRTSK